MRITVLSLVTAVLCIWPCKGICEPLPGDWASLEQELRDVLSAQVTSFSLDFVSRSPRVRAIIEEQDLDSSVEMVFQSRLPLVNLAGFYCLKKLQPDRSVAAALHLLMNRDHNAPLTLCEPLLKQLAGTDSSEALFKAISAIASPASPQQRENFFLIANAAKNDVLQGWFERERSSGVLITPTAEAIVLGEIWEQSRSERKITPKMRQRLADFATIPGIPRMVFVSHTERRDDYFRRCLVSVLEDPTLTELEIYACVTGVRDYVQTHVRLDDLNLSEQRRKTLESVLSPREH